MIEVHNGNYELSGEQLKSFKVFLDVYPAPKNLPRWAFNCPVCNYPTVVTKNATKSKFKCLTCGYDEIVKAFAEHVQGYINRGDIVGLVNLVWMKQTRRIFERYYPDALEALDELKKLEDK